jgi:GT2 family glycosyltransferase
MRVDDQRVSAASMVLSLVTGLRNRPAEFQRLLRSIRECTPMPWELVVSDASDTPMDESSLSSNVRIIREVPRLGCTRGYNVAFKQTQGEWVIWLNDDCEVLPGYAEIAIRFMETHPHIGLGALYYDDPHNGFHVNTCGYQMLYANFGILSRELGNHVGWFDEDLVMYGCDNSLAYRVLLAGKGIAAISGAHIHHHASDDAERLANQNGRDREAWLLRTKYGPYLDEMRATYEAAQLTSA